MDAQNYSAFQYRMTELLQAQIEMEAMKAANAERAIAGVKPAYGDEDFRALINQYGIHHNAAMEAQFKITA